MRQLCEKLLMPVEATRAILEADRAIDPNLDLTALTREERWAEGRKALKEWLGEDPEGFKELCCMLRCALAAKGTLDALGFSEEIYYDTMACFTRFVNEHMESYGRYGFDRGFWTVRQVSCKLLRIGSLEYELIEQEGKPVISLHIPSDADLSREALRSSYLAARDALGRAFPAYRDAPMYCHSWLLSPTLAQLLPEGSRILAFQRSFAVTPLEKPNQEFRKWVFKTPDLPMEQYPEHTSLQRALKRVLLNGGTLVDGKGYLVEEPFVNV